MKDHPKSLKEVLELSWEMLVRGSLDKKDALQVLTLVTYDGNRPNPRSVILRSFDRESRKLICHTDQRAGKVDDLQAHAQLAWHGWHPRKRVQLRIYGKGIVHQEGEFLEEQWSGLSASSRLNYSSALPPARKIENYQTGWESYASFEQASQQDENPQWKNNFCVIESSIEEMDFLMLRRGKHLRAGFRWTEEKMEANWLVP